MGGGGIEIQGYIGCRRRQPYNLRMLSRCKFYVYEVNALDWWKVVTIYHVDSEKRYPYFIA